MSTPHTAPTAPEFSCDVLVVGGGPAGSTISALLAERGRDVVLPEKAHHPRFHIGESLLPANVGLFGRLGVREAVERIGMPKWGVEFVSPDHPQPVLVEFAEAWDKSMPYAWQVRRSELDELLFRNAAPGRAHSRRPSRARGDIRRQRRDGAGRADDGARQTWRTRFLVDASGRDTLLANHFKCKEKNPQHNSSAIYGHFRGARRLEGKLEGNITIFWFAHGWFWFIPLADGSTSVGAVCWPYYLKSRHGRSMVEFFHDTIASCPGVAQRLEGATLVNDVYATGNYSYSSAMSSGERF